MLKIKSNALVGMVSKHMENYRFSQVEAAEVNMTPEDTGVIILIILYFIEHEPKICRSKLEYYLLLLDRKCFLDRAVLLFNWSLKNGRIRNFKRFIEFMIQKQLICLKGSYSFELTEAGKTLSRFYAELVNIKHWLDEILHDFKYKTAKQTEAEVIYAKCDKQYMTALSNVSNVIKLGTDEHIVSVVPVTNFEDNVT